MRTTTKPTHRFLEQGLSVITNKDLLNGEILIPKGSQGKIVYHQNQVAADVWFNDVLEFEKYLKLDSLSFNKTKFRGLVFTLNGLDFSIFYNHSSHSDLMFTEEQLNSIPYLNLENITSYESNLFKNNERVSQYRLSDIISDIDDNFSSFVNELEQRPSTEDDNLDLDFVFTDSAFELFELEKQKILEPFTKATGVYYNFLGGAIEL